MSDNCNFKIVQGFEFPTEAEFNDDAIFILGTLQRRGCAYIETDDCGAKAIDQLEVAAESGYFDVFSSDDCHRHWVIISDHFEVILMNPCQE